MTKEYIERETLRKKIFPYEGIDKAKYAINAKAVEAAINGTPASDVVEVVHGEWIKHESMVLSRQCSNCKGWYTKTTINEYTYRFCPNCGAKMDGERKDER